MGLPRPCLLRQATTPTSSASLPPLLLLLISPHPSIASTGYTKVATGWSCQSDFLISSLSSGATLASCYAGCTGNCTAFTFTEDGSCWEYSSCPILGRRVVPHLGSNFTGTYALRISPELHDASERGFGGAPEDYTTIAHSESHQRQSWTFSVWLRPVSSTRNQAVLSNELSQTGFGLWIEDGRWVAHAGNSTFTLSITSVGRAVLHAWSHLVVSFAHETGVLSLEVDGILQAQGANNFQPSYSALHIGRGVSDELLYRGSVRDLRIYSFALDSHTERAIQMEPASCLKAPAPNEGFVATHENSDHGASHEGLCLYMAGGEETCTDACSRLVGGTCDPGMEALGESWLSCAAALQRLGAPFSSASETSGRLEGCVWGANGHKMHTGPGATCDSQPPPSGNDTRYRVCACTGDATPTLTPEPCGPSREVCAPCPHLLFDEREWRVTSDTAACAQNSNGTGGFIESAIFPPEIGSGLDACRARCEGTPSCQGVDYFGWTGACDLYETPCTHPLSVGNGSSSHRMLERRAYTCPRDAVVSELQLDPGIATLCACRDHCASVSDALYGAYQGNSTGGFCSCFSSCASATEVSAIGLDCGVAGCANITSFYIDIPTHREGSAECRNTGVQKLGHKPFLSLDTINATTPYTQLGIAGGTGDLGVPVFGGAEGFTFSGWFRREGPGGAKGWSDDAASSVWRITNLGDVSFGWEVCEMEFFFDDDCTQPTSGRENVTFEVHGLPFRSHTYGNASLAGDGDVTTCAAVSCGEFSSKLGCSPQVASYIVVFSEPVNLRCASVFQENHYTRSTPELAVEKLSDGGTWIRQWDCYFMQHGEWEQCGVGTGIVYVDRRATWEYAREECIRRGGDLLSIGSEGANRAAALALHRVNSTDAWLGASRYDPSSNESVSDTANTFKWSDGRAWSWMTDTVTVTFEPPKEGVDLHRPGRHVRDYSNWGCGNPVRHDGDCAFMYGRVKSSACTNGDSVEEGQWGPLRCELSREGILCNITDRSRPAVGANKTETMTLSPTLDDVTAVPISLLHCSAGVSDDAVSLKLEPNSSSLTYTVQRSAPSNFPLSTVSTSESQTFPINAVPRDSAWHHLTISHKQSGVVNVAVDFEPLGGVPFTTRVYETGPDPLRYPHRSMAAWFSASTSNTTNGTSAVERFHDSSGSANPATARGDGPSLAPASTPGGAWPSIFFGLNATRSTMQFERAIHSETSGITIIAVVKPTGAAPSPHLLDMSSYFGVLVGMDKVSCFIGSQGDSRTTITTWSQWNPPGEEGWIIATCIFRSESSIAVRINGHEKGWRRLGAGEGRLNITDMPYGSMRNASSGPHFIGSQASTDDESGRHFTGYLAELLVYSTALAGDAAAAIEETLSIKYFGGKFMRLPHRLPRSECAVGAAPDGGDTTQPFVGSVRDVAIFGAGSPLHEIAAFATGARPPRGVPGGAVAHTACTAAGHCGATLAAREPVLAAGFLQSIHSDASVFEGHVSLNALPSGDQPIFTYGGSGCGEGSLTAWVYPVADGYSLGFGEWDGAAVRSAATLAVGQRYRIRMEVDMSVGTPTSASWYGVSLLGSLTATFGVWRESGTKCYDGTSICIVAGDPGETHAVSVLSTDPFVLTGSTSAFAESFGTPGSQGDIAGRPRPHSTGFAGVALYDTVYKRYILSKSRSDYSYNTTGLERLGFTPWELRGFGGRKVRFDLIDAYCTTQESCSQGWIGFGRVWLKNANPMQASAKISVQGSVVASGRLRMLHRPFEAGDISLLARCHNDTNSGALSGTVNITLGCPIHHTRGGSHEANPMLQEGNGSQVDPTPTPSATLTHTPAFVYQHFFDDTDDDYNIGRAGNMGPTTFGGGAITISFWIKLYKDAGRDAVIVDFANAPREHRAYVGFHRSTGGIVYRVEEEGPYEMTRNGVGDPEVGQLPSATGSEKEPNILVDEDYLTFVGCYSNYSAFGGGYHGVRWWNKVGGNLQDLMHGARKNNWKYIALANTPAYEAADHGDGGSWYFNTLLEGGDLERDDCAAVSCDSGLGICGCAGGGDCGTYAVSSNRCPPPDSPTGTCAMAVHSWAVWKRVYPDGPQIPADGQWHHVGVVHKHDSGEMRHGTLPVGTAMLFIDHVRTHSSLMILPSQATRVNSLVGRSNYGNHSLEGIVKEVYLWDGELTQPQLAAIAKRTMLPTYPAAPLAKAAVQDYGAPAEGYGQCLTSHSRMRDPRMCTRPVCECEHNGFRCAVSSWRFNYQQQRQWGESWGSIPLTAGGVEGLRTYRLSNARCYVSTHAPEGCQCEGEVAFYSFDPAKATRSLDCKAVLHAFGGRLAPSLPPDVLVPSDAGIISCPNI